MKDIFPDPIEKLPKANIPIDGLTAYLSQAENHQILFMRSEELIDLPEHSHESQWGIILEGRIDLTINGAVKTYSRGDRYFIPAGVSHSAKIYAGYAEIIFFNEKNRYTAK